MKNPPPRPVLPPFFFLLLASLLLIPPPLPVVLSQVCPRYCGPIPLKYPFGAAPGCGDSRFQKYIYCTQNQNQQQLIFATHTGCYPITSIDYSTQAIYLTDPSMSSCFATQRSHGFGLDWDAPFTFLDSTLFALLACSSPNPASSATICSANCSSTTNIPTSMPQCDARSAPICGALVSGCQPLTQVMTGGAQQQTTTSSSSCCVYTPVDLGPAFEMDLGKMRCGGYTAVYDFDGDEGSPEKWKYGIAVKYKFNYNNASPANCAACESTNGACGYGVEYGSFLCNCPSGQNTSTDCWFQSRWNRGSELIPWTKGKWLIFYPVMLLLGLIL